VKRTVFLAVAGAILMCGFVQLSGPLATMRRQADRLAQLRMTKTALEAEQGRLTQRKEFLATERGQEIAARRQGYLRPGERRLVFYEQEPETQTAGALQAETE
jgi:hypothetical protein